MVTITIFYIIMIILLMFVIYSVFIPYGYISDLINKPKRTRIIEKYDDLISACEWGDVELVKQYIYKGIDVNMCEGLLLKRAYNFDRKNIIYLLIDTGNVKNEHLWWVFICACLDEHITLILDLISKGISVDIYDGRALKEASERGSLGIVKLLIDSGADINARKGEAFMFACGYRHLDIIKLFISKGVNVNNMDGKALIEASERGNTDIVKILIDAKADVNAQNGEALIRACECNNVDVVKLLIESGADIHIQNDKPIKVAQYKNSERLEKIFKDAIK